MDNKFSVLKKYFGYDNFREGQEELIDSILNLHDTLGIMPTGGGKSICYQIPALLFNGITIIISPLISLMKDQVNSLSQSGVPCALINSTLSYQEMMYTFNEACNGKYKIIYVAPERLLTDNFLNFSKSTEISMVVIDEAHCVSQWGHNFRQSYLCISDFVDALPKRPVVSAFTATATKPVKIDIIKLLKLNKPKTVITGYDRTNLYFSVLKPEDKFSALLNFLKNNLSTCGIVYCSTRKTVDEVCERLIASGYSASKYHAGLNDAERQKNQDNFIYDKIKIMVATNAFGMGIDKSDVSFVVHYNMPKNIESYYQEAGRAGRDGHPAQCILFYSGRDAVTARYLINNSISEDTNAKTAEIIKKNDLLKLNQMIGYCTEKCCLRWYILNYFGEHPPLKCNNCSNCNKNSEEKDITVPAQKILSCIIRMTEQCSLTAIKDVLRGIDNNTTKPFKALSTFGIMENNTCEEIEEITQFLKKNGYIRTENKVLKLNTSAREILFEGKRILIKTKVDISKYKELAAKAEIDENLLSELKALRSKIAKIQSVPAYVIFTDSTLNEISRRLPRNETDLLKISGVGEIKLQRYGDKFLKLINNYFEKK